MSTYKIDKSRLDDFLIGRRILQWIVVLTFGIMLVQSNFNYDTSDKTTKNIIWYCIFSIFCYLVLIGILLILKKFNSVVKMFLSWDMETTLKLTKERIEINHKEGNLDFALNELTMENFEFYGWYMNPLYGLGYAVITTPTGQTIRLSSILFDLGYGADKVDTLFESRVKKYSKRTISWFTQLPPTKCIINGGV